MLFNLLTAMPIECVCPCSAMVKTNGTFTIFYYKHTTCNCEFAFKENTPLQYNIY